MRWDRRDLSPAWAQPGPLLAAGPWLRDVLMPNPRGVRHNRSARPRRAALARSAGSAQLDDRSSCSVIIFHDGWYYLLVTDAACCAAANSNGDIRIGRSRKVTGPFVDNMGIEMLADLQFSPP